MSPATVNVALPQDIRLRFYRGDDMTFTFAATGSLTGQTLAAQVYDGGYNPVGNPMTVTVAGQNVTCHLAAADSAQVPPVGWWDCRATTAAGAVTTLAAGQVRTLP